MKTWNLLTLFWFLVEIHRLREATLLLETPFPDIQDVEGCLLDVEHQNAQSVVESLSMGAALHLLKDLSGRRQEVCQQFSSILHLAFPLCRKILAIRFK